MMCIAQVSGRSSSEGGLYCIDIMLYISNSEKKDLEVKHALKIEQKSLIFKKTASHCSDRDREK